MPFNTTFHYTPRFTEKVNLDKQTMRELTRRHTSTDNAVLWLAVGGKQVLYFGSKDKPVLCAIISQSVLID
jgi:hypothetical protein